MKYSIFTPGSPSGVVSAEASMTGGRGRVAWRRERVIGWTSMDGPNINWASFVVAPGVSGKSMTIGRVMV